MKFSTSLAILSVAATVRAAPTAEAKASRCENGRSSENYLRDNYQPWIQQLYKPCVAKAAADGSDFWKRRACVAAAVAMGPRTIVDYATCDKGSIPKQDTLPYLDYGVYASIVGDCAYDAKACGVSRQNLLDLVYGELSKAGATVWPASADEILADVIGPVFTWAAREPTIPYSRFNKWLSVSGIPGTIIDDTHTNGKTYYYDHEDDSI